MFNSITDIVDTFVEMFETVDFEDQANLRFMVALKDDIVRRHILDEDVATILVASMTVDLPADMHKTHPDDFDRLVDAYATIIFKLENAVRRNFDDNAEDVLLTFAKSFNVQIDA